MRLSICIPTHQGRAEFLAEAIDSVVGQLDGALRRQVEICVSDNASSDGTEAVMRGYAHQPGLAVVYRRNPRDLGAHANVLKVFELARGDYVWFLGSDDALADGAIARVMGLLAEHTGLAGLTVNRENFDLAMRQPAGDDPPHLRPERPESLHVYGSFEQILTQCGLFHTYGSSQIVDRALWLSVAERLGPEALERFANYPHVYVIGKMIQERPHWIWCPDRLVKNRSGNWTLHEQSGYPVFYCLVTIQELTRLWRELAPRGVVRRRLVRKWYECFAVWYNPYELLRFKRSPDYDARRYLPLLGFVRHLYFVPKFWRHYVPILVLPGGLLGIIQQLRQRILRRPG